MPKIELGLLICVDFLLGILERDAEFFDFDFGISRFFEELEIQLTHLNPK